MLTTPTPSLHLMRLFQTGVLAVAGLGGPLAHGQAGPERATFMGLSAGAGLSLAPSSLRRLELPQGSYLAPTSTPGGAVALALLVRVQRGRWIAQPELRYQEVDSTPFRYPGVGGGFGSLSNGGDPKRSFRARQFGVSALGGRRFGPQKRCYALLGPAVAFRYGNDGVPPPNPAQFGSSSVPYAMDRAPEKTQLQLHGGVGVWGKHVNVELRYLYGLSPLVRQIVFNNQAYGFKVRASTLVVALGYNLSL